MLEKLLAGEVLEIRVVDPALAHPFIGQAVNVLEQQKPDHEPGLDPGPAVLAVERRDLVVDPSPIDLAGELNQFVLQIDDLLEPCPEQIAFTRRLMLLRSHRAPRCEQRIMLRRPRESQKSNRKPPPPQQAKPCESKPPSVPTNDSPP